VRKESGAFGTAIGVYNGVGDFILDSPSGAGNAGSTLKSESRSVVGKKISVEVIDVVYSVVY